MKKNFKLIVLMLLGIIISPSIVSAKCNNEFEYFITPKSEEWKKYSAYELQDKLNIPKENVDKLNTKDLLDLVLDYPFIGDVYAFNTVEDGINEIRKRFNPLDVLLNREDIAKVLYNRYINLENPVISKNIKCEESDDCLKINFIEFLLEKNEVFIKLNEEQIREISKKAVKMSLESEIESEFEKKDSVFSECYTDELKKSSSGVYTPRGTYVEAFILGEQLSQSKKNEINSYFDKTYPNAKRLRGATTNYNCHSYAWYSTSANNRYWINDTSPYKNDGSYTNVGFLPKHSGQILYYPVEGGHSAIVNRTSSNIWGVNMTSKWGRAGLYNHNYGNDPYASGALNISNWRKN
ncbi:hypothetical protein [Granulicatella elegans]|uniref:hypothetical protein n=1 Tax=Granulicatella elegans TaxID=137732 RepID=UPI001D1482D3|nr:hypothetical protein [Granulicatella elegans]UEA31928.1 hypothetical protein LK443_03010 [Granulicatella elegans]